MFKQIFEFIEAIETVHAGKYNTLDVHNYSDGSAYYNQMKDKGYQKYLLARTKISKHKVIEIFLLKLKIICL